MKTTVLVIGMPVRYHLTPHDENKDNREHILHFLPVLLSPALPEPARSH